MLFEIIALNLLFIFYVCYYIKQFLQRRKGIKTNQIAKGKKGIAKFIESLMAISTILIVIIELINIFQIKIFQSKTFLEKTKIPEEVRWIGAVIAVIGLMFFLSSMITMKDNWRAGVSMNEDTTLVTKGIFKVSRNPAFLGFDLVYIGILLMFFSYLLLGVTIIAIVIFHLQIVLVEEKYLSKVFKEEYLEYKKQVNRYFGIR